MDQKEVEVVLKELEERLDRLRASYDQYFMGFEKLEPTIPRKEVDRRFAILRKEQIRNTALRYRFNVVTQKYSTYSMYWNRICRQIEEGTFKRHVQRAEKRFGRGARRENDLSVDIDMADFDEVDIDMEMDDVLAEAERHAASFDVNRGDTVPPGASDSDSDRPPETPRFGSMPSTYIQTPGTSFAIPGRRERIDEATPPPAVSPANGVRIVRGAQLPAGAKPRILRKVVKGPDSQPASDPPPSHPTNPNARAPMPSQPSLPADRPSAPRIAPAAAPGVRPQIRPRAPMQSSPEIAPSERRLPIPPPSGNRIPVPLPPPSNPRLPVPPARRPAPSVPDFGEPGEISQSRPSQPPLSGKPRPPLPSQLTRKKDG